MEQETVENFTIVQDHRHKTSSVWKYFGDLNMNGEFVDSKHVYCTKCFDEARMKKYQKSTSTGNLIKHLKRSHNVAEQPSYRVKQDKDRIVVTKEESNHDDDDDTEYYVDGIPNFVPLTTTSSSNLAPSESDTNEYLVHDINELLILEISKRPQIYDPSLCPKNKGQVRRQLWLEIYDSLNHLIEYEKLPKIWKNIRDRYQKIKKDQERDGRALDASGKPRYRYYNQLQFLDDIVECNETNPAEEDKMSLPIENFVSNFIYMEDEPQVEQPDHRDEMIEQPMPHHQLEVEGEELNDEEDDDVDEEDDDDQLHDENDEDDDEENNLTESAIIDLNADIKEDLYDGEPSPQKKIKLEHSIIISHEANAPLSQTSTQQQQHLQSSIGHHRVRDLMTPDNIASLLVEQHQHEILCHQHSDMSVASTIASSPSSSSQVPIATWRISPHLAASIGVPNNSALQHHHIQQMPIVATATIASSVSTTTGGTTVHHLEPSSSAVHSTIVDASTIQSAPETQTVTSTATPAKSVCGSGSDEFVIFGSYLAEVMRNMDKQKARMLQMKVMQLITEYDGGAQ